MFMGFLVVSAVLVVSFGRLGDMSAGPMYNLGFRSSAWPPSSSPSPGCTAARGPVADHLAVVQGIGGAFLFANSTAILTDAFRPISAAPRWASTRSRPSEARSSG